ncbi:exonuclease SbcCD subunit D [Algicola sagamiensis]|uniref:exonuclease SbcCD subunit D n=1 Tax=Algicola sagamiensis TaxID=163869 RepID=UPI0003AAB79C|nr:exonuclease SbcCD subunit D [Algicola sagamiensis]
MNESNNALYSPHRLAYPLCFLVNGLAQQTMTQSRTMKILHTSDWHLGRFFHNISLLDDQRHILNQLIQILEQEQVDVLIIAGDIYDRSVPPAAAVALLDDILNDICGRMNIPVVMISGNHDGAQRMGFAAAQLKHAGLHILTDIDQINVPVTIQTNTVAVDIFGIPYHEPDQVRHIFHVDVSNHDEAHTFLVNHIKKNSQRIRPQILISHCFVDGAESCDSERPLSIGGADSVRYEPMADFDYVALGHLHQAQYKGKDHIRYSGSPLKYSFSEQHHKKGFTIVEFDSQGCQKITQHALYPLRNVRVLEGKLAQILESASSDEHIDDYLMVRLTDNQALLDPMNQLRAVYPNVLHLEKTGLMHTSRQAQFHPLQKRDDLELFRNFFEQVAGQSLSHAQEEALQETFKQLKQEGEDA